MLNKELLDILRCPLDPTRNARLEEEPDGLVCQRCRLKYPIKEGLPCMLVEDAILPPGASSLQALPCQQTSEPYRTSSLPFQQTTGTQGTQE